MAKIGEVKYCPYCEMNVLVNVFEVAPETRFSPAEHEAYCSKCGAYYWELEDKKEGIETYYPDEWR
jgi:uncharacterized protein with PIN domain